MSKLIYHQRMKGFQILCALLALLCVPKTLGAAELIMVERGGCEWCEAWNTEVGVVYDKTQEGQTAPLRRIDIHEPLPDDLEFIRGLIYTPTFVLIDKGREFGRIRGYAGEDFFWGLLQELLEKLPANGQPGGSARTGRDNMLDDATKTNIRG